MNLAALSDRNLEQFGSYEALVFEDRRYTNVEIAEMGFGLAGGLRELGIRPGDAVIVLLPNRPEVSPTYMGILRAGAVVVPVVFLLRAPEVRHIARHSRARLVVTSPEFAPLAAEAAAGLDVRIAVVGDAPAGTLSWSELAAAAPLASPVDRAPGDPALYMYTSGTTGTPKGVVLTQRNVSVHADAVRGTARIDRERDFGLGVLPQAHAAGLNATIIGLTTGIRAALLGWFTPEGFFDAVERHGVTTTLVVPAILRLLLEHPDADRHDLSTLEDVVVGAAPCPVELAEAFERRFGAVVREGYGLTEATAVVTTNVRGTRPKPGSAGPPISCVELRIAGPDGEPLPPGEHGEVVVRGESVMAGYLDDPEATAEAIRDGWLHTGDVGHVDEDGHLYVIGRVKDLIIRGGENVYPGDVERVLAEHPTVSEAAAVGVPHPVYGEEVAAFVVAAPGQAPDAGALVAFAAERLAKYKAPKTVHVVDALPRNAVGKVLKRELRERLAGEASAAGDGAPAGEGASAR